MQMMINVVRQQYQTIEDSDRWQIIDLERCRLTSELAWNLKFLKTTN